MTHTPTVHASEPRPQSPTSLSIPGRISLASRRDRSPLPIHPAFVGSMWLRSSASDEAKSLSDDEYADYEEVIEEVEVEEEEEVEEDEGRPGGGAAVQAELLDSSCGGLSADADGSSTPGKLFVGGIAWATTEESFAKHFRKYGKIVDYVIKRDKQISRGFGFVTFADPSVVEAVLKVEHVIDGKTVEVKRAIPRNAPSLPSKVGSNTKRIFVGGLPSHISEEEFKDYFSLYGVVVNHHLMIDHSTGRSRGFGFVTFEDEEIVDEVMAEGKIHEFAGKQVTVKRAEPKPTSSNGKAETSAGPLPVGGVVYGFYGGGVLGYGGGYGFGDVAGPHGGGYGYAAAYSYGMGLLPSFPGSVYGYGAGAAGYGTGAGLSGYGVFRGMGQSGGGAAGNSTAAGLSGSGVFRGMGQSGGGAAGDGTGAGLSGSSVFRGMDQSGGGAAGDGTGAGLSGYGVFRGMGQSGGGAAGDGTGAGLSGDGVFRGLGQSGERYHPYLR